eukprot:7715681-Alexandrium_andersonii.AAC.1
MLRGNPTESHIFGSGVAFDLGESETGMPPLLKHSGDNGPEVAVSLGVPSKGVFAEARSKDLPDILEDITAVARNMYGS